MPARENRPENSERLPESTRTDPERSRSRAAWVIARTGIWPSGKQVVTCYWAQRGWKESARETLAPDEVCGSVRTFATESEAVAAFRKTGLVISDSQQAVKLTAEQVALIRGETPGGGAATVKYDQRPG
jgi:hypothetical protein